MADNKQQILLAGGSGFIGKQLTSVLLKNGYEVGVLSRQKRPHKTNVYYYYWNPEKQEIEEKAILNAAYIINLAGENIGKKRWTEQQKKRLLNSRLDATNLLYQTLLKTGAKPKAFISASAVGIYGSTISETLYDENAVAAHDFLGTLCHQWEAAALQITTLHIRTVILRTGLVLGKNGGMLQKLKPIFKYGFASVLGSGKQYMPWIHLDDLCQMYLYAVSSEKMNRIYNAVADYSTTNETFTQTLANLYGYQPWLPKIPSFLLQSLFGEMSVLFLTGQKVANEKIKKAGFQFRFTALNPALRDLVL